MIQRGDEFVTFVWETVGLVTLRDCLHVCLLPALPLVGIENLHKKKKKNTLFFFLNISWAWYKF